MLSGLADFFMLARATMHLVNRGRTRVRQPADKMRQIQHAPTHRSGLCTYARESGGLIAGEAGAERATAA